MTQQVDAPTHIEGGILDVFITRSDTKVTGLLINPPVLSDHSFIPCAIPRVCLPSPLFVSRLVRGWKKLDHDKFNDSLRSSPLCREPLFYDGMSAADLFTMYDDVVRNILDQDLPKHRTRSRQCLTTPWFDAECRSMRLQVRCLERRYRRTKAAVDRQS